MMDVECSILFCSIIANYFRRIGPKTPNTNVYSYFHYIKEYLDKFNLIKIKKGNIIQENGVRKSLTKIKEFFEEKEK